MENIQDKKLQLAEKVKTHIENMLRPFGQTPKVEINLDGEMPEVILDRSFMVYVDYRDEESETIIGKDTKKNFLFDIVAIEYNPGVHMYPDGSGEPPSEEEIELGTKHDALGAAYEVVSKYMNMLLDSYVENVELNRMEVDDEELIKQMMDMPG
ncbi:MAG: hypothetical protein ACW99Q_19595 [Candidatus Kariarchaeaceae archaeon]|jgi:hypothetical protein